ncbi:unnamed protein product (macronuclear) [Paramecium tetraurelia]|uniref:RING-type domain-containing protein n=1 Tax=Paramecium tetraurelia TaxID=5888 RepID=A0C9I9_PARTE|nr:uncharacterized protein GSPATT00006762001 [Paramecium tetraurelia]CAK67456.1 unnamed protein product [Paramecium tetraurelia]|eukprot:XP_001434853.1 hypothetical protein (macronuclear) [Paramecium tetraurelia strain d4-2]
MQSSQESRTFQCNLCSTHVPQICQEVHNVKCTMKNLQETTLRNQLNEQSQIPQQQNFPQQINFTEKANNQQQFQQTTNSSQQFRIGIISQQNQQNISSIIQSGTLNAANNVTRQIVQSNATQEQQPAQTQQFQISRISQQTTSSNISNQQFQRFLELQRSRQPQNQQTNTLFRTNYGQQQQPVQQAQFPQQQPSFIQITNNIMTPTPNISQIQQAPRFQQVTRSPPQFNFSRSSSILQTANFTQRTQNIVPSDDSSNEDEEIHEVSGLNNFDLLKNYTDEEVNQMNDEQFYQYFIHKQIMENHLDEPDIQIQRVMEQQNEFDNQCVICQETIKSEEETMVLVCEHKFHEACISNWISCKSTCPICKTRI